ncbi:MAG: hypothetical protein JWN66_3167 [Sphingomonas bacterium]|uniref:hypothetical protein n=1 Tax=Sphingomonas bacterium TaxID=1895847 RepID=UPI00262DBF05|nr:hypothetical protein [Sphingomonas bacterium]MDB5706051.1 hypothetical protein [Sphingomonas bacterium]
MGVEIATLRLRGPPEAAVQARFLIEDGIRTAWPDEERLVLIRRVALAQTRPGHRPIERHAAFRRAYDVATASRRHGGDSGAADANCVWFASRAEAWRLLLRALLAGRTPDAWFWRLVVPEWHGEAAEPWLAARLEEALAGRGEMDAVTLVETVEAAGASALLFAAVERLAASASGIAVPAGYRPDTDAAADIPRSGGSSFADDAPAIERVALLAARLPAGLVHLVETLALRLGPGKPAVRYLLERLLLRASPSLRLSPPTLAASVRSYASLLSTGRSPAIWLAHIVATGARTPGAAPQPPVIMAARSVAPARAAVPSAPGRRESTIEPETPTTMAPATPDLLVPAGERATPAAGLWLVIPALIRLGFREWLAERPAIAAADGGRQLLRVLGRHYRLAPDDPALAPLGEPGEDLGFETAWRVGLDRYYRHRARIRLADVILRPGRISVTEDRVTLRFPPEAADIRLRRRALDVDPGWTDWLGLVVRYRYAERNEP